MHSIKIYCRGMLHRLRADAFIQDLSSWNVAAVTDMQDMFYDAIAFNHDLSSWNIASVTDMSYMFGNANAFNQDLSLWNVASDTDMAYMIYYADAFNKVICWDKNTAADTTDIFVGSNGTFC
jgi:surface protein